MNAKEIREKTKMITLGTIEVKDGKLIIGDPCYKRVDKEEEDGLELVMKITTVKNGKWTAGIQKFRTNLRGKNRIYGGRVARLILCAEGQDLIDEERDHGRMDMPILHNRKGTWHDMGVVGVDSGLMSIATGYFNRQGDEWSKFCDSDEIMKVDEDGGCVIGNSEVISQTGLGDGGYSYFCYQSKDSGEIEVVEVCFMEEIYPDEEEDAASEEPSTIKDRSFKEILETAKSSNVNIDPLKLLVAYAAEISLDKNTPDKEFEERCKKAYEKISASLEDITGMDIPEDKR